MTGVLIKMENLDTKILTERKDYEEPQEKDGGKRPGTYLSFTALRRNQLSQYFEFGLDL